MPPAPDLSFTGLDEFVNKHVIENCKAKSIEEEPKVVMKNDDALIIKEWVSDNEEEEVSQPKIEKKTVKPGHLNFKTMNKAVKRNLVRDLPSKLFENDQTCVACKGKAGHSLFLMKKMYCLVVIDDYSRFTWVFFLATKDETSGILKSFIIRIENLVDHKVKVIRYDNRTEFKNREMNQFFEMKGILRQFSVARTPQQNKVAKRRTKTLIEAAKTMLADSKLPTTFWAKAVNTACYVQNKVKAFRVFNSRTRIVEENLHIRFSESTPNIVGSGPDWLFNIDALTRTMNYETIFTGAQSNSFADPKSSNDDGFKFSSDDRKKVDEDPRKENECNDQEKEDNVNSTNNVNIVSSTINVAGTNEDNELSFDPNMPALEDVSTFDFSKKVEDDDAVADMNNLDTTIKVSPVLTTRIHKDHPLDQVIGDLQSATQTRKMSKYLEEHRLMHEKFQMSSMGELTFFLGLQAKEKKDETFISQDKYVAEILKKFRFTKVKTASTPMETQKPLLKDEDGEEMDVYMYRSIIGSLLYLTSLRPDIMFAFWSTAMAKTINGEVQIHARVDGKEIVITESSIRQDLQLADEEGIDYLPNSTIFEQLALMGIGKGLVTPLFQTMVIQNQSELGKGSAMPTDLHHTHTILQPSSSQLQKTQKPSKPKRKDTQVPQPTGPTEYVADEAVHKELGYSLVRAATTASSLEAEQDSGNVNKTQYKATPNESSSQGTSLSGGSRCQETMWDTISQIRMVKKLEKRNRSRTHKLKRLYKVGLTARVESFRDEESLGNDASKQGRRINAIDADDEITLVNDADNEMFNVNDLGGEEVFVVEQEVVSTAVITETITTKEITLAQALEALKTLKPKAKRIIFQEPGKSTTTTTPTPTISSQQLQDKGKRIMIEEPVKLKKKDQIRLDKEDALKLHAGFDKEERLA
nr:hypothetical protein [Tanacetum cinerariifolium]